MAEFYRILLFFSNVSIAYRGVGSDRGQDEVEGGKTPN